MRIEIRRPNREPFIIHLPTGIFLNRASAHIFAASFRKKGLTLSDEQLFRFLKAVKAYKQTHGGWTLVDAVSSDGNSVHISV